MSFYKYDHGSIGSSFEEGWRLRGSSRTVRSKRKATGLDPSGHAPGRERASDRSREEGRDR